MEHLFNSYVASSTHSHLSSMSVTSRETVDLSSHLKACKTAKSVYTCGKWKWSHSVVSNSLQLMDCSLPGSSVHGIFQARILEWVAISFSRVPSWPRDWTRVSCTAGRLFTVWATRDDCILMEMPQKKWLHCIRCYVSTSVVSLFFKLKYSWCTILC